MKKTLLTVLLTSMIATGTFSRPVRADISNHGEITTTSDNSWKSLGFTDGAPEYLAGQATRVECELTVGNRSVYAEGVAACRKLLREGFAR